MNFHAHLNLRLIFFLITCYICKFSNICENHLFWMSTSNDFCFFKKYRAVTYQIQGITKIQWFYIHKNLSWHLVNNLLTSSETAERNCRKLRRELKIENHTFLFFVWHFYERKFCLPTLMFSFISIALKWISYKNFKIDNGIT